MLINYQNVFFRFAFVILDFKDKFKKQQRVLLKIDTLPPGRLYRAVPGGFTAGKEGAMEYIITGATGHIGYTVTKLLAEAGEDVKILIRKDTPYLNFKGLKKGEGDVLDPDFLLKNISKGSTVIHCAGKIALSNRQKREIFEVNYKGTLNVADACEKNGSKLIYVSSTDAIADKNSDIITEPHSLSVSGLKSAYSKSKCLATMEIQKRAAKGLNACVVYPSAVIGPYDYKISAVGSMLRDYLSGKLPARIDGAYNFVDVRDVARGIISAARSGAKGESYLLCGSVVTVDELLDTVNLFENKKMPVKLPVWFVRLFAGFGTIYYAIRGQKAVFSRQAIKALSDNCNFCSDKAKVELGYNITPFQKTIEDTLAWLKSGREKN